MFLNVNMAEHVFLYLPINAIFYFLLWKNTPVYLVFKIFIYIPEMGLAADSSTNKEIGDIWRLRRNAINNLRGKLTMWKGISARQKNWLEQMKKRVFRQLRTITG